MFCEYSSFVKLSINSGWGKFIFPPSLFLEDKTLILINIPFCEKNKNKSKDLIKNPPFHKWKHSHKNGGKYNGKFNKESLI